jgi:hypothetical protein
MRKASLALIICISVRVQTLYAVCKTDACKQATAWKNGYTAIVLDDNISRADYFAVLDAIKANKGVVAIEAERVLLGWLPTAKAGKIRAVPGVSAVLYEAVPHPEDLAHRDEPLAALSFFNRVRTGAYEDTVEAGLAVHREPLTGCIRSRPTSTQAQTRAFGTSSSDGRATYNGIAGKIDQAVTNGDNLIPDRLLPGIVVPQWGGRTPFHNPAMRGRITVQLFRLDSDGSIDHNDFTWTDADFQTAHDQVYSAYTFWVDQANLRGITLSFRVLTVDPLSRRTRTIVPTPIHYEPINRPQTDGYLWINDALAFNGYGASPVTFTNVLDQNEAFNDAKAADPLYGPFDGSFSVYIVYNPFGAPSVFRGGGGSYAETDGPYAVALWNDQGSGPANLYNVVSHESGHIFWACDEYAGGCNSCDICVFGSNPRPWATNGNCADLNATGSCTRPSTDCMMKYESHTLCPFTPAQIGW